MCDHFIRLTVETVEKSDITVPLSNMVTRVCRTPFIWGNMVLQLNILSSKLLQAEKKLLAGL